MGGGTPVKFQTGGTPARSQMGLPPSFPTRRVNHPANGATPSGQWVPWGTPIGTGWGYPQLELSEVIPPSGLDGVPPPSGLDGVPPPCQDWMTVWECPPSQETEQQSELLLHGRRYASCVHTEELSCYILFCFVKYAKEASVVVYFVGIKSWDNNHVRFLP